MAKKPKKKFGATQKLYTKGRITLLCRECSRPVVGVAADCIAVECSICVAAKVPFEDSPSHTPSIGPPGWHFRAVFVAEDGTVYHKGVSQPKLKGTLPPTKVVVKKKTVAEKRSKIENADRKLIQAMKTVDKRGRRPKKK